MLKKLINAARLAPSAGNLQPLEYLVVTEDILKERIFPNLAWAGYIKPIGDPEKGQEPAAYIIILVNKRIYPKPDIDIGASAENINIVAQHEGIGCCWIESFKNKNIVEILNIPQDYAVRLILALGYPAEKPVYEDINKDCSIKYYKDDSKTLHVPKRKLDDIIRWNSFLDY